MLGRLNSIECHSSALPRSVRHPPLIPHFPYLFYTSLSTRFSVFLSFSFLVPVHLDILFMCPSSLLLTLSLFSMIFFVTLATFTSIKIKLYETIFAKTQHQQENVFMVNFFQLYPIFVKFTSEVVSFVYYRIVSHCWKAGILYLQSPLTKIIVCP